ncbi:MAG: M20/M25/M40 family metallo-hydrolase [Phycisphaerales bacterium]
MATLASLPQARAARGDIAAQQGLAATEGLILGALTEMGYAPTLEPIPWNLKKQEEFEARLRDEGRAVDSRAAPETTDELASRTWHNIVVELPGMELPREVLIVGAHIDAVPGSPGADDNGSGVAALLEAARVLRGVPLRRTVRLVFFNLEEIGLHGSREHWRKQKARLAAPSDPAAPPAAADPGETLVGMVSLEMLGFYSEAEGSQRSPIAPIPGVFEPPTVGDFIAVATIRKHSGFARQWAEGMLRAAQPAGPPLKVVVADMFPVAPPDFLRSDHQPFLLGGQPALMLTDTSNFRNPHYHRATDTAATLDPDRYAATSRGVVGAIVAVAEPAGAPAPAMPPGE